jgi:hypothetical protein
MQTMISLFGNIRFFSPRQFICESVCVVIILYARPGGNSIGYKDK